MSHVKYEPIIKTNLVCIKCGHIKGICTCKNPDYILDKVWLHVDTNGNRDYQNVIQEKTKHKIV